MIKIEFTKEDIEQLRHEKKNHPHPRVRLKMEALLLKSSGLEHGKICGILGISPNTLTGYLRRYKEAGIERLKEIRFYQPQSDLAEYSEQIAARFEERPPASLKEAASEIEKICGIRRSQSQVRKFLLKLGMSRVKVGSVPAKMNPEEQEEFKKNFWSRS
jgi:transposase